MSGWRIHLGPGGVSYLLACGLAGVAAYQTQNNLILAVMSLLAGGLVVSLAAGAWTVGALRVSRLASGPMFAGSPGGLGYEVRNLSRWWPAFNVVVGEWWPRRERGRALGAVGLADVPCAWVAHAGPGQMLTVHSPVRAGRRGLLALATVSVSTTFPFGLLRFERLWSMPMRAVVLPRLGSVGAAAGRMASQLDPSGVRPDRPGDADEVVGVRPYRAGDSPRQIDWRRTAHLGELISRELAQPSAAGVRIVLDLTGGVDAGWSEAEDAAAVESAVSLAGSWVVEAGRRRAAVALTLRGAPGQTFGAGRGAGHERRLLEALALVARPSAGTDGVGRLAGRHAGTATVWIRPGRDRSRWLAGWPGVEVRCEGGAGVHRGREDEAARRARVMGMARGSSPAGVPGAEPAGGGT